MPDQHWLGSEWWGNRLQDWQIKDGRLECVRTGKSLQMRTVHLLSHRLKEEVGDAVLEMKVGTLTDLESSAAAGFLIGAGAELNVLGASLVMQNHGRGGGLFCGVDGSGNAFIKDMESNEIISQTTVSQLITEGIKLQLTISESNTIQLKIGESTVEQTVEADRLIGNVALVSHPGSESFSTRFWFDDVQISGSKFVKQEGSGFGPIISAQHTLSNDVLKMTAQLPPIAASALPTIYLDIQQDGQWKTIVESEVDTASLTAHFRVENWDSNNSIDYRLRYGKNDSNPYTGTIRRDPADQNIISIAGLSCNHNVAKPGLDRPDRAFNFDFSGIWYPHSDLVAHLQQQQLDLLFFTGDQIYEGASPTFPDRKNAKLDYLYKWYLWCMAFRDLTKELPVVTIPDDHDIFQGNIWGAGGRSTEVDHNGGYVMPAEWVKMVERTQTSHLPDPYDSTPVEQGIGVYYTSMNYGRIGMAILEDRKFKSGCANLLPYKTRNRPDHINDPDFDISEADVEGLTLLGDRQLTFLEDFAADWNGHDMKLILSQTVLANLATHHGDDHFRLIADLDSNGWPQTGRNKALKAIRKGYAFMLAGDQHLPTLSQHGVDDWGDAGYAFVVPAIANFYQRAWFPEKEGLDRAAGAPGYLGKHIDGLGNKIEMLAVANPASFTGVSFDIEPLSLHAKMPGYGVVRFNKSERSITAECWPRYIEPQLATDAAQYDGWPKTVAMQDNFAKAATAYLPMIEVDILNNPVFQVWQDEELIYSIRPGTNRFQPKVFAEGEYLVKIGSPETGNWSEFELSTADQSPVKFKF